VVDHDAPEDYIAKSVRAIVGVEVRVEAWEASSKLSQNRPPSDIDGVVAGLRHGDLGHRGVADRVEAHRPHPDTVRTRGPLEDVQEPGTLEQVDRRRMVGAVGTAVRVKRGRANLNSS
jgi:hypothetical protein